MQVATKRALIATAALAAAAVFGSLPYQGPQAMRGAPTVHRDVALVDTTDTIVGSETALDDTLFNDLYSSTGLEADLYNSLSSSVGATEATALLDATGASPIYSGDFDGALSRAGGGVFFDTWASENELNTALGLNTTESETAILTDIEKDFIPIPSSTGITDTTLADAIGTSTFNSDLTTIANADYALASSDFEGWLANLPTAVGDDSGLGGLTGLLGDLGGGGLGSLGGDLTTILGDLTGGLL